MDDRTRPEEEPPEERPLDEYEVHFDDGRREPSRLDRIRRDTAGGALATALALGLQQVFDPEKKTAGVSVEQMAPTDKPEAGRIELNFDPLDSRSTSVVVRPPDDRQG